MANIGSKRILILTKYSMYDIIIYYNSFLENKIKTLNTAKQRAFFALRRLLANVSGQEGVFAWRYLRNAKSKYGGVAMNDFGTIYLMAGGGCGLLIITFLLSTGLRTMPTYAAPLMVAIGTCLLSAAYQLVMKNEGYCVRSQNEAVLLFILLAMGVIYFFASIQKFILIFSSGKRRE